jgi:hypothetical protein
MHCAARFRETPRRKAHGDNGLSQREKSGEGDDEYGSDIRVMAVLPKHSADIIDGDVKEKGKCKERH